MFNLCLVPGFQVVAFYGIEKIMKIVFVDFEVINSLIPFASSPDALGARA
jgi:hypothetical protein